MPKESDLPDKDGLEEGSLPEREDTKPFELKFKINKEDADSIYGYLARTAPEGFPKIDFIPNPDDGTVTMILVAKMDGRRSLAKGLRFIYNLVLKMGTGETPDDKKKAPDLRLDNLMIDLFDDQPISAGVRSAAKRKPTKIAA